MKYKFGFILALTADYLRQGDLSNMKFLNEDIKDKLTFSYDKNGVLYILEDVNMRKSDKLMQLLKENNIETTSTSIPVWKDFEDISFS